MRVLLFLWLCLFWAGSATALEVGEPAPALALDTIGKGHYDLADKRGEWVLVNFWATWCGPCLKEMPELDAFDRERTDASVVGLAFEEIEPADLEAFLQQHPVGYPVGIIDAFSPPAGWDSPRGLPLSLLIDPQGKVAKKFLGPVTRKELDNAIGAVGG